MVGLIEAMKKTGDIPVCAVMQDACEYTIDWPDHWKVHQSDEHLEMAGSINALFKLYPNETFYGMLDDHTRPISPGWSQEMQKAAGRWNLASGWNLTNRMKNERMRINCYAMGGDLARSLGWVWPDFVTHMYGDDALEDLGYELGVLKFVEDAVFRPLLLRDGTLKPDENSLRRFKGEPYIAKDRDAYLAWRKTKFKDTVARVASSLRT